MRRIIKNNNIYQQASYKWERDYEAIVKTQLGKGYPDFFIADFKIPVLGEEGIPRAPDLAMVHKDYKMWCVIEVELPQHPLNSHVMPQVAAFVTGDYDEKHAKYLVKKESMIEYDRMLDLVKYNPPKCIVAVSSRHVLDKGWGRLSDIGVELMFLEVFKSDTDDVIYSLNGYEPRVEPKRLTGAKKNGVLNALSCKDWSALPIPANNTVRMVYESALLNWNVIKTADSVLLWPEIRFALRADRNYEILQNADGQLELRVV